MFTIDPTAPVPSFSVEPDAPVPAEWSAYGPTGRTIGYYTPGGTWIPVETVIVFGPDPIAA